MRPLSVLLALALTFVAASAQERTTICDVQEYDAQGLSPLQGQMVTVRGVVTCPPGYFQTSLTSFYIEAGGCGVNVFMFDLLGTALALGDSVEVYGEVAEYISAGTGAGATTQIITSEWAIAVLSTGNPAPEPTELSCAEVNMEENEGRLLSTVGVVTEMQLPWFFYITDGTAEVEVYFGVADSVNPVGIYPGDRLCITGLLGQYDYTPPFLEGYELMPRTNRDIWDCPASPIQYESWGVIKALFR